MVRLLIEEQVDAISRAVGVTDLVLPKPFSLDEVRRTVEELLDPAPSDDELTGPSRPATP
jgi:hypothetical protein